MPEAMRPLRGVSVAASVDRLGGSGDVRLTGRWQRCGFRYFATTDPDKAARYRDRWSNGEVN